MKSAAPSSAGKPRLLALDVLRGITIAAMLLVNTPGSWDHVYSGLEHAEWNGLHMPDFVFPFFLFMVGTAMSLSLRKFRDLPKAQPATAILKRAGLLILIGILVHAFPFYQPPFSEWRFPGVLQRIGLCYGIAGLMVLFLSDRALIAAAAGLLLGYWGILVGWGGVDAYAVKGNVDGRFDTWLFGVSHLWNREDSFDPEGLLGTLPAIVTALQGFWAGRILQRETPLLARIKQVAFIGLGTLALGFVWSAWIPINKALWTSSYVLVTGGAACLALAALLWILDVRGIKKWSLPFQAFGTNALFAYCMGELWVLILLRIIKFKNTIGETITGYDWLYLKIFEPFAGPLNGSLLFAAAHVCAFGVVLWILFQKKILIKI